jgi:perosamine synthetase
VSICGRKMKEFKEITSFIRRLYNQPTGFIPLHAPVFLGNEKKYLEECIDSTFVSSVGKFVDQFEQRMAEYTGAKKAVACVNGTSALHLALKLVGVEPETEVITQPLTFIATANAITYCGAKPVFLDVDMDTMGLSPEALKNWLNDSTVQQFNRTTNQRETINKTTKRKIAAAVPMHTFGFPCRIDEIVEICNEYNIPVVEDAAESLGSFYDNRHTGTFGEVGVLSFNGNKVITTGGGGMLLFQDEALAAKAKHLSTQAKVPHPWEFIHDEIGYNYRMPNINAALGLAQLEKLPEYLAAKQKIAEAYKAFFINTNKSKSVSIFENHQCASVDYITEPQNSQPNYWLNCILFADKNERDAFLKYSNEHGVMTRPAWRLMHDLAMFSEVETGILLNAKMIASALVNIPSSTIFNSKTG